MNNELDFSIETKLFRAAVLKSKMMQYQSQKNRVNHPWLRYVGSTEARFMFASWLVHAFYSERPITASYIKADMGISRKAIDEMVNDWTNAGWLFKEKGTGVDSNKIFLHCSEEILMLNNEWFEWFEDSIAPMVHTPYQVLQNSKVSYSELKKNVSFNTTSGANLSGIDDNVASFILNNTEEKRSKRIKTVK